MKRLLSRYIMDIANTAQNTSPRTANSKDRDTKSSIIIFFRTSRIFKLLAV